MKYVWFGKSPMLDRNDIEEVSCMGDNDSALRGPAGLALEHRLTPMPFDAGETDLHYFHPKAESFRVRDEGHFTKIKKLADAINGKVYCCRMKQDGRDDAVVAVKKMENCKVEQSRYLEANEQTAFYGGLSSCEDCLAEIGVLLHLHEQSDMCRYLIKLIGVFRDDSHTVIVMEHCDGGELLFVAGRNELREAEIKGLMWQLLRAVNYLHSHNVGHRDISLENLLLKDKELRLMDFGQAVLLHFPSDPEKVFRYFRPCGKKYYRGPECYVPLESPWRAPCPLDYTPGCIVAVQHQGFLVEVTFQSGFVAGELSVCDPCGYQVGPLDLFACGVVLFILRTQAPPWEVALPSCRLFRFICSSGCAALWRHWGKRPLSPNGMKLLEGLIRPFPTLRLSRQQCLSHDWFADLDGAYGIKDGRADLTRPFAVDVDDDCTFSL